MRKIFKPEKVTGVVALAYLVLIPAAGIFLWNRLQLVEREVEDLAFHLNRETEEIPRGR